MMKFTRRWRTSHPFSLVRQVSFSFFVFIFNPFQVCGKQFERRRRWCLDQHLLSHETERKFKCDICEKYFRNSSYLKTHRKACLGVKDEECAFCGKKFAQRAVLINHERIHTGETPYECRICKQSFRTHHIYSGHGKTVHQAISAKHFQQMQDEAVARGQQAADEAEERTGDHLLPACTEEEVGGEAEGKRRENQLLPPFTGEEAVERTEEGRLPIRPLVDEEAHPPLQTKITF